MGAFGTVVQNVRKHSDLNGEFWVNKIVTNRQRDIRITKELTDAGWTVFRIPEHDVRTKAALLATVDRLVSLIREKSPVKASSVVGVESVHSAGS